MSSSRRRSNLSPVSALLVILAALISIGQAAAEPARIALVIGNSAYTVLPATPMCALAARAIGEKLRTAGYDMVERNNVTTGGFDEAIGDFGNRLTRAPGATAFVYACTRGASLNDRAFLLPVSATLERPTDILTQGILAKSLYDVLARGKAGTTMIALDIVPPAAGARPTGFDAIAQESPVEGLAAITVMNPGSNSVVTPFAQALLSILGRPVVETGTLVSAVQEELGGASSPSIAVVRRPKAVGHVVGQPPAPPPAPPPPAPEKPPSPPPLAVEPPPPAPPPVVLAPPTAPQPTVAPPAATMPEEHLMTLEDRRRIQEALRGLGYYTLAVDGIFGAETRAAIRKYQMQLMAQPTGRLTPEQAMRLVSGR